MRAMLVLAALLAVAACKPDITAGTYYCGDEESCPADLRCDGPTAECVYPQDVEVFTCPDGTNAAEPDDAVADALDIGDAGCGGVPFNDNGCIDNSVDVDHIVLTTPASCDGTLDIRLRFPLAFVPLALDLLAPDGTVVQAGEITEDSDTTAQVTVSLRATVGPGEQYILRIRAAPDAPDCDGACAYNRYSLSVL
jgi:hypothetical protein